MQHHSGQRKFHRETGQRYALLRSLAANLIEREKITTTEAKAKELRPFVERLITHARAGTLAGRRQIAKVLIAPKHVKLLADTIGPRYADRKGGYTRITKLGARKSDGSKMAQIELV